MPGPVEEVQKVRRNRTKIPGIIFTIDFIGLSLNKKASENYSKHNLLIILMHKYLNDEKSEFYIPVYTLSGSYHTM